MLVGFWSTPLSHISFLPTLMQVNFFPETIDIAPALLQDAPALGAAIASVIKEGRSAADKARTISPRESLIA